jgi:hypothetical protein
MTGEELFKKWAEFAHTDARFEDYGLNNAWVRLAEWLNEQEAISDKLIAERNRLLYMEELRCPMHGRGCVKRLAAR